MISKQDWVTWNPSKIQASTSKWFACWFLGIASQSLAWVCATLERILEAQAAVRAGIKHWYMEKLRTIEFTSNTTLRNYTQKPQTYTMQAVCKYKWHISLSSKSEKCNWTSLTKNFKATTMWYLFDCLSLKAITIFLGLSFQFAACTKWYIKWNTRTKVYSLWGYVFAAFEKLVFSIRY